MCCSTAPHTSRMSTASLRVHLCRGRASEALEPLKFDKNEKDPARRVGGNAGENPSLPAHSQCHCATFGRQHVSFHRTLDSDGRTIGQDQGCLHVTKGEMNCDWSRGKRAARRPRPSKCVRLYSSPQFLYWTVADGRS